MSGNSDESGDGDPSELSIVVKLVPEKKGLFLKYSEYEIKSKAYDKVVRRRYKDFLILYTYLMERYPYRMIPVLPPKQLILDSLPEERRHGLQTWLTVVSMHPVLGCSPILIAFMSDKTMDYQYRMRVMYEKQPEEFSRLREDVELPWEDQEKLIASRDRLRKILYSLHRLRKIFDEQAFRTEQQARDMAEVDLILQSLEVRDVFAERTFDNISQSAQAAARQTERYVQLQRNVVNERIHVLMDLLAAHNDLCQRVEKGIFSDHQKALSKMLGVSRNRLKNHTSGGNVTSENGSTITSPQSAPPASEIPATGDAHLNRKCAFALQCVRSETALAEQYLQSLPAILLSYANEESQYHSKVTDIEFIRANRWKYFINFSFAADVEDMASASS
ncbi:sorting nexin-8-like isoform X4 [Armigeres subalbatus]|uniref:sorting nexin-8-like isoform X4 n=1 Tax=Armigeres subalbatus TaxID=124917 RepID=UPI002ED66688